MTNKIPTSSRGGTHLMSARPSPSVKHIDTRAAALALRRELARVERALAEGESSDEREDLLLALQRLDDGSYGICIECARRIPDERLEVMPATRCCVQCAR